MALGGVGEAMLFSAALGGGTAALTGGDPLKGALLGGLTGGIGAGISGLAAGQSMAQLLGTTAAETAGAQIAGNVASGLPTALPSDGGISSLVNNLGSASTMPIGTPGTATASMGSTAPSAATNMLGGDPLAISKFMETGGMGPSGLESIAPGAPMSSLPTGANATPISSFMDQASSTLGAALTTPSKLLTDPLAYLKENKVMAGSAALAGALGGQRKQKLPERKKIEGLPLWAYRAKEGGIASLAGGGMPGYDMVVGETPMYARGGVSDLGTYSDGGRMLKGAGDGMSDSIPGVIAGKRPARLADGEFVVPADVVSHLGNGSTDAGAKQLYRMMDKVRAARTGTKKQGRQINPRRFMPA